MDKNSLTAIILTFLLVFIYMQYFGPKSQVNIASQTQSTNYVATANNEKNKENISVDKSAVDQVDEIKQKSITPDIVSKIQSTDLKAVTLSNSLITITFSTFGGDIEKIKIHKSEIVKKGPIVTLDALSNSWETPLRIKKLGKFNINNVILYPEFISENQISFTGTINNAILIKKVYTLKSDNYLLNTKIILQNLTSKSIDISNSFDIWLGRINKVSLHADRYTRPRSVDICRLEKGKLAIKRVKASKKGVEQIGGPIEWLAVKNKYFTHILIPDKTANYATVKSINYKTDKQVSGYANFTLPVIGANDKITFSTDLYAGPSDYENLKKLPSIVGRGGKYVDIINLGMFSFLAKPILVYGLKGLYKYIHNYGWAIIIITIIIKLITWPLQTKSFTSMQKMQKIQPELKALQEKYKDDKAKLQQEMMLLYRKHGVNPLGGCLPMLLQLPIFFALFAALSRAIELWGASFLWIKDLSLPDNVATLPFSIPFLGNGVNPLAIVMGAAMIGQQALMPSTGDASQKKMMYLMPVVMMFLFYKAPSGLVLYWLVNQLISMGQMFYLHYLKKS